MQFLLHRELQFTVMRLFCFTDKCTGCLKLQPPLPAYTKEELTSACNFLRSYFHRSIHIIKNTNFAQKYTIRDVPISSQNKNRSELNIFLFFLPGPGLWTATWNSPSEYFRIHTQRTFFLAHGKLTARKR